MTKKVAKPSGVSNLVKVLASAFSMKTSVSGTCYVYSSAPIVCPLCQVTVPANTRAPLREEIMTPGEWTANVIGELTGAGFKAGELSRLPARERFRTA